MDKFFAVFLPVFSCFVLKTPSENFRRRPKSVVFVKRVERIARARSLAAFAISSVITLARFFLWQRRRRFPANATDHGVRRQERKHRTYGIFHLRHLIVPAIIIRSRGKKRYTVLTPRFLKRSEKFQHVYQYGKSDQYDYPYEMYRGFDVAVYGFAP